ncbi:MAG: polyphosphate kinase 2 [Rhodobacteraceae bacterium]|nr:polyphosphate kinase 2 [Paracoccaceae bacterium]
MNKPFDSAISRYFEQEAPAKIRARIENRGKKGIMNPQYPYEKTMKNSVYIDEIDALQVELVKLQAWAKASGQRIAVVFEGRDAAGKGGSIKRLRENLNPRGAQVVALAKPTDAEQSQWYFQRYISHLPAAGEIVFFDRSWYNRAVVEKVFGWCSDDQRKKFFRQVPKFEEMLVNDGITLIKIWLTVGRAEQLRRFLSRESDRLKHWKLSEVDVKGLSKWNKYSTAIGEMFEQSHTDTSPWHVIRSDDKKRARLAVIKLILSHFDYTEKDRTALMEIDNRLCGSPARMGLEGDT